MKTPPRRRPCCNPASIPSCSPATSTRTACVVPTQLANLWLAGNYVLAEAGGALLRQPPLWLRLVKATIPARLGSVFGDSRLPARSVVVCVSIERILAPNTTEQIRALAQTLNERLRQLSQTLGISLPVYVLFTKLDTVTPFAEYVSQLTEEEVKLPIGSLLSSLSSGSGLYTEQATATDRRLDSTSFSTRSPSSGSTFFPAAANSGPGPRL
jgi:type VI secretion system protein ImpL